MGDMQFNGTPEEWDALVKRNKIMTAVDWFKQQISTCSLSEIDDNINEWFKEAKQMEKQQIIDAATWGALAETGEQYYKEKYKK